MPLTALMTNIVVYAVLLTFPFILAFLARRMLGAPIGWPRSLLVGLGIEPLWFWLLSALAPWAGLGDREQGPDSAIGGWYLIVVLSLAWAFALGVAALVLFEVIAPTGSIPTPLTAMRAVRRSLRQGVRTLAIGRIALRHGLVQFTHRSRRQASTQHTTPEALTAALEECGPTFVKLGQMLSSRRDLVSDDYVVALSRLQSQVRPAEWSDIRAEVEEQLGGSLDDHFLHVDETPLAAASIAQVHAATLLDGTSVVIKVQRPEARARVFRDVELICSVGATIEARTEWGKSLGITALVDGFAESLAIELDFTAERRHLELIRQASMRTESAITIPAFHPALSTETVLTMDRAEGTPIGRAADLIASRTKADAAALAGRIFEAILHQILIEGVFHADLHPGNILLGENDEVILLDFGSIGIIDRESRLALARLLSALDTDDAIAAVDALSMMCTIPGDVDSQLLERDVGRLLTIARASNSGSSELFPDLFRVVRRHRILLPPAIAAALRAIATLEGTLLCIDRAFDIVEAGRCAGPRIQCEIVTPRSTADSLEASATALAGTGARLPRRIESITADIASGAFARRFHPFADRDDRAFLRGLVHEFLKTIIAVALVIASVALTVSDAGPLLAPTTMHATTYFGLSIGVVAFVLIMRVLVRKFDPGGDRGVRPPRAPSR
ncbi:ABC1 kinase family protein [Leifsonia sp. McL0607]|uniref:ABC1 kinase family protein n=1 Tax=Leifsonia sp. McL0607 TaxID=3415672 RepID=UPI003CF29102